MDDGWFDALDLSDVVHPWPMVTAPDGTEVRLVRVDDDRVVAVAPFCPHMDQPLTSAEIHDGRLECPRHWYAFDLDTGACVVPARDDCRLDVWPVRIDDGRVLVHVA